MHQRLSSDITLAIAELEREGFQLDAMEAEEHWQSGKKYWPPSNCHRYAQSLITAVNWTIEQGG